MKRTLIFMILLVGTAPYVLSQVEPLPPENSNNNVNNDYNTTTSWSQVSSTLGSFWALMPGEATYSKTPVATAVGEIIMHQYILDLGNVAYFIAFSDYPQSAVENSDAYSILQGAVDGVLGMISSRNIISQDKIVINGYPAIKSHVKGIMQNSPATFKGVQVLKNNRLYQTYVLSMGNLDESAADRFINSFTIEKEGWVADFGDNSSFRFSMPGKSTFSSQPTATDLGNIDFNMHVLDQGNAAWFASYSDYPQSHINSNDPKELIESSYSQISQSISSLNVIEKQYYKLNGHQALKVNLKGTMNLGGTNTDVHYRAILALVQNRLYQIYVLAVNGSLNANEADYFQECFQLIKP